MEGLEELRGGGDDATVRAEELVRRAGPHVGAQGGDVDRGVRRGVDAVDPVQRAHRVDEVGDAAHRGLGADEVGGRGRRDEAGPLGEDGRHGVGRELTGGGVEVDPADRGARGLGGLDPRADVRVVVEAGDDDLVAGTPLLRHRPREVVGEGGGAATEDDPAGVGPEQVGEGGAGVGDDPVGPALGRGGAPAVADRTRQGVGDGAADDVGDLAPPGPVEVGGALREGGEAGADGRDVVGHGAILYQDVCSGRPSANPAVLCRPTVALSWNSSRVRAPA